MDKGGIMEVLQCRAVLAAADSGSITAAAELMGYTQSGITRIITGFEEELGFPLFSRSKKGVELTENGRMMLPLLRSITQAHQCADEMSADIRGSVHGTITIGSYYSISALVLPKILKAFSENYPGVSVSLREGGNQEMARWLTEKSVDFCFCAKPSADGVEWLPLFKDELVVWLPKESLLAKKENFPVRLLEKEPFIHTSPGRDTDLDRFIKERKLNMNTCFSTKDAYTTYNMVEAGLGISFNQRLISQKWHGEVAELPMEPRAFIELGIAIPSLQYASPAVKRFMKFMQQTVKTD